jgi:hypothetical protein
MFVVVSGSSSERTRAYEVMWGACDDVVCGTGRKSRLLRRSRQEQRTKVGCTGEDKWLEVEAMKETQKATQWALWLYLGVTAALRVATIELSDPNLLRTALVMAA